MRQDRDVAGGVHPRAAGMSARFAAKSAAPAPASVQGALAVTARLSSQEELSNPSPRSRFKEPARSPRRAPRSTT